MYIFCHFEEVSAIKWSKMVTFSITGSQIFFANFVNFARNKGKTGYRFTVPTTNKCYENLIICMSVLVLNSLFDPELAHLVLGKLHG